MAVSLSRATQCPGREVVHDHKAVRGTVVSSDMNDVWIKTPDGDIIPCIPAHLTWVSMLTAPLREAIKDWQEYDGVQVGFAPFLWRDEDEAPFSNLGIVYSGRLANDDGMDRALYAVAPMIQKVQLLSITANPSVAWEIEELMGWAEA